MNFKTVLLTLAAAGVLVAVGCGDDSGTGGSGNASQGGEAEGGSGGSVGDGGAPPTQLNGCDRASADDLTGGDVDLTWSLTHQECFVIDVGSTVTWTGTFGSHPLNGGPTGDEDTSSAISTADQSGASASVTFTDAGVYPYHCGVHQGSMQGVVYVE